jgi:hypothetical protein
VASGRDVATQTVTVEFSEPVGFGAAAQSVLAGADCVLFFNIDIDGGGVIGDATGEVGNVACATAFQSNELDPPGPAGLSGYSRFWQFVAPLANGVQIPAGTNFEVDFSRVSTAASVTERPDGRVVPDLTLTMP